MMSYDLKGKTALITGAASGMGYDTAHLLGKNGCRIAINYLDEDERGPEAIDKLRREGLDVLPAVGNVGAADNAASMVRKAIEDLGRLDFLVNNAGIPAAPYKIELADMDALTPEIWLRVLEVNLMGSFWCARAASQALRQAKGAIVNVASIAGTRAGGSSLAYAASKAALIKMTVDLATGLAPEVRVNAVAPGFIESSWGVKSSQERIDTAVARTPLKRRGTPRDVAEVTAFLCASAGFVTGQTIVIDGGLTLA